MSDWTTAEPSIGTYWLSIAPEKRPSASGRTDFPAVIMCHVAMFPVHGLFADSQPGLYVHYDKGGDWLPLAQDWFKGAQWKRVDMTPTDPFAVPRSGGKT